MTVFFLDRLKIVTFENVRYLQKKGADTYMQTPVSGAPIAAEGPERPAAVQGFVEASNVNVVNEMVRMIEVNRAYEANQKNYSSRRWNDGQIVERSGACKVVVRMFYRM